MGTTFHEEVAGHTKKVTAKSHGKKGEYTANTNHVVADRGGEHIKAETFVDRKDTIVKPENLNKECSVFEPANETVDAANV